MIRCTLGGVRTQHKLDTRHELGFQKEKLVKPGEHYAEVNACIAFLEVNIAD